MDNESQNTFNNEGVEMTLTDGRTVMLGSQKAVALEQATQAKL